MGVVHLLHWGELASLDVESHLLIGITERHASGCEAVNLLHAEHEVVARIVEDMLVHLHLAHHGVDHRENSLDFIERRQEILLGELQVAEIAHRQIVGDHCDLEWQRLQTVATCARQFKHIGIFLVRHNRRAGGELVGEFDEREVLRIKHTCVERQF